MCGRDWIQTCALPIYFYNQGTCTNRCPQALVYNSATYKQEVNPDARVAFGKVCLKECPGTYIQRHDREGLDRPRPPLDTLHAHMQLVQPVILAYSL